jgi:prolyl-tRNA editing enzyme YbaK/EbsC (Cys-tRNA(Pro) deacylase)
VLERLGLLENVVYFERSTKTAQLAADAMGCELGQIAKSLVFVVDGRPVLALVAGDRRGDVAAIARESDGRAAAMADAETVRAATGYSIGGVSPFDLPPDLTVLVDESLSRFGTVYPAAGTPSSMVRMPFDLLVEVTGGRVAPIAQEVA